MIAALSPFGLVWVYHGAPVAWICLALLTLRRLGELVYARRNTRRLLARGAREYGAGHYPAMVAIHAAFLLSLWLCIPPYQPIIWPLLIAVLGLQAARLWVLATLGEYWTTRIISSPDFPRIRSGPFRLVNHPNYWIVTFEIALIPLVFGQFWIALLFSALNAAILTIRIRTESVVLAQRLS